MACCGKKSYNYVPPQTVYHDSRLPLNQGSLQGKSNSPNCPKCANPMRVLHTYSVGSESFMTWVCQNAYCGRHLDIKIP